jgi:hypothetical protein
LILSGLGIDGRVYDEDFIKKKRRQPAPERKVEGEIRLAKTEER